MEEQLVEFLSKVFGEDKVSLAYSDRVTKPGLSIIYYENGVDTDKQLDGTTNMLIWNFVVQVWDDSMELVIKDFKVLFDAMEGTEFQISNIRAVRVDGNKRKWHKDVSIRVLEDI